MQAVVVFDVLLPGMTTTTMVNLIGDDGDAHGLSPRRPSASPRREHKRFVPEQTLALLLPQPLLVWHAVEGEHLPHGVHLLPGQHVVLGLVVVVVLPRLVTSLLQQPLPVRADVVARGRRVGGHGVRVAELEHCHPAAVGDLLLSAVSLS